MRTLFPVGHLTKEQVREKARALDLRVAEKPESQDICFVPDGNYARFLEQRLDPDQMTPGEVVDQAGQVLGRHEGIHRFTVGQRRGLGLGGLSEPRYVTQIDAPSGRVIVGTQDQLNMCGLRAKEISWVSGEQPAEVQVAVKIRYRHTPIAATVVTRSNATADVWFQDKQPAVTPGQAVVFYDDNQVLGGGWIEGPL